MFQTSFIKFFISRDYAQSKKEKEESEGELEDEDLEDFLDWRIKKLS